MQGPHYYFPRKKSLLDTLVLKSQTFPITYSLLMIYTHFNWVKNDQVWTLFNSIISKMISTRWVTRQATKDDSDVGDIVMLMTLEWWLITGVGGKIIMLATFLVILVIFSMY